MQKTWSYKNFEISEGLKPGSTTFRYFFAVSGKGGVKCHYCVWIADEALSRFDSSKNFEAILSAHRETWRRWVEEKIDAADFRSRALKFDRSGEQEINLSDMKQHIAME